MNERDQREARELVARLQAILARAAQEQPAPPRPVVRSPRPEVIAQVAARRKRRGQR